MQVSRWQSVRQKVFAMACGVGLTLGVAAAGAGPAHQAPATDVTQLRVVGGLAGVHQYTRHESPFWREHLPRLSGGSLRAEVVPFDQAGLPGHEMLRLVQLGVVPFGTALLSLTASEAPQFNALDLPGLNPDIDTLRRHLATFRPHMQASLRERYGIELLAVYAYPAQVLFCRERLRGLQDLTGRVVRTSSVEQSDLVEALGGAPVRTPFAEVARSLRDGQIDCAITGTMSGYTIGLPQHASHVHALPVNWGLSAFLANGAAWRALPAEHRALIRQELPRLEQAIWDEAGRETAQGLACATNTGPCPAGPPGKMTLVRTTPQDAQLMSQLFRVVVLDRWLQRCGMTCARAWNATLMPVTGIELVP